MTTIPARRDRAMQARRYADWFLTNTEQGKTACQEGYFMELRKHLEQEGMRQLRNGRDHPSVTITGSMTQQFTETAKRIRK